MSLDRNSYRHHWKPPIDRSRAARPGPEQVLLDLLQEIGAEDADAILTRVATPWQESGERRVRWALTTVQQVAICLPKHCAEVDAELRKLGWILL